MRQILLPALVLGGLLLSADPTSAEGVLGFRRGLGWSGPPPVVVQPYPYAYPYYGVPAYQAYPYFGGYYGGSYFRPEAPVGWNAQRNWRDTWQDDGVKTHAYTLR